MKAVSIRWKAWHGDETCELTFPDSWDVQLCAMADAPRAPEHEVRRAFSHPISSPPLDVIADGAKSVAIAVDDLTRPTPTRELLPIVLEYLRSSGIQKNQIKMVVALGVHPPLSRDDLAHKLGTEVVRDYRIVQHHASENLQEVGIRLDGIPVKINKDFLESDLKISMGCITPHPFAGFSGGGKTILPGLASTEIIERTHRYALMGFRGGLGVIEGNQFREEVEEVSRKCGVNLIIDVVVNQRREMAGVFVGDVREAFLKGVHFARKVYPTSLPIEVDVAVLNAYPKDTDLIQSENGFNVLRSAERLFVRDQGKIVLMTASSHGRGAHGMFAPGGRLYREPLRKRWLRERGLIVYSPGVSEEEVRSMFWKGYPFCQTWGEVLKILEQAFPNHCRVAVFPCGSLQLGVEP